MRTLLLGIDSGTQSTKVLVVDARDGKVLASAAQEYDLIPDHLRLRTSSSAVPLASPYSMVFWPVSQKFR